MIESILNVTVIMSCTLSQIRKHTIENSGRFVSRTVTEFPLLRVVDQIII